VPDVGQQGAGPGGGRVRFRKSSARPNPRQTLHQGLLYKWGLRRCIQINSERQLPETKNIYESKIYNYFPILRTLLVKYVIDTISNCTSPVITPP
jgi:hypothetical protein